ncbi:hypothetical protein [Bradyrhizobium prioriisuperbiae]|uniref:hypothetical protein n=1 Tax=Bradyrhizobium prioriisuperbiae TaxID=2854389 RepID=UPI0028EC40BB|nr:hypothetical protein [Bradyrhizobium prioritasuperba]
MTPPSRQSVPSLEGYGLTGLEIGSPATFLHFLGDERVLSTSPLKTEFNAWTFTFFGASVSDIDYSYDGAADVSSFNLVRIGDGERDFNFGVDLVLKSGRLKLKCYDYYCYSRKTPG